MSLFDDDHDGFWAARFGLSPQELEAIKAKAADRARQAYDATTRKIAQAGDAVRGVVSDAERGIDKFRTGVQTQLDRLMAQRVARQLRPAPSPQAELDRLMAQRVARQLRPAPRPQAELDRLMQQSVASQVRGRPTPDRIGGYHLSDRTVHSPSAAVDKFLRCTGACAGENLRVTSTSDSHPPNNPHTRGLAADVTTSHRQRVMQCGANCGARYQLDEYAHPSPDSTGGHVHMQLTPGKGGATGPYYPK